MEKRVKVWHFLKNISLCLIFHFDGWRCQAVKFTLTRVFHFDGWRCQAVKFILTSVFYFDGWRCQAVKFTFTRAHGKSFWKLILIFNSTCFHNRISILVVFGVSRRVLSNHGDDDIIPVTATSQIFDLSWPGQDIHVKAEIKNFPSVHWGGRLGAVMRAFTYLESRPLST